MSEKITPPDTNKAQRQLIAEDKLWEHFFSLLVHTERHEGDKTVKVINWLLLCGGGGGGVGVGGGCGNLSFFERDPTILFPTPPVPHFWLLPTVPLDID